MQFSWRKLLHRSCVVPPSPVAQQGAVGHRTCHVAHSFSCHHISLLNRWCLTSQTSAKITWVSYSWDTSDTSPKTYTGFHSHVYIDIRRAFHFECFCFLKSSSQLEEISKCKNCTRVLGGQREWQCWASWRQSFSTLPISEAEKLRETIPPQSRHKSWSHVLPPVAVLCWRLPRNPEIGFKHGYCIVSSGTVLELPIWITLSSHSYFTSPWVNCFTTLGTNQLGIFFLQFGVYFFPWYSHKPVFHQLPKVFAFTSSYHRGYQYLLLVSLICAHSTQI